MSQLRITVVLMHVKPSCTGSSCLTNHLLLKMRKWQEAPRAVFLPKPCVVRRRTGRGCRKPDLTSGCQRSFPPDPQASPCPQSFWKCHPRARSTSWPKRVAKPLVHTEPFLVRNFHLLCCLSNLSALSRSANISLLSPFHGKSSTAGCGVFLQDSSLFQKWGFADRPQHVQKCSSGCAQGDAV